MAGSISRTQSQGNKAPETQDPAPDPPNEEGYGWVCVGATFLLNAHTWGINSVGTILVVCLQKKRN